MAEKPTTHRQVLATWAPLAASWVLMALELPVVSAFIARSPDPNIHLAAYGGVVFPLALLVEAPIIMLLAASTALGKDWASYVRLRRFMLSSALGLTAVHLVVAATPLFEVIVVGLMDAPEPIRAPSRIGLLIMTPWTAAIAYRRFQQGVLIRFHRSTYVGLGTGVRLLANVLTLGIGFALGTLPGIVMGTAAVSVGVVAEAVFIGNAVRPVLKTLRDQPTVHPPLTLGRLLQFYIPLALTPLIGLLGLPLISAGICRMPQALESLAAWPVLSGVTFGVRSLGIAYNEVVVALLDRPGAFPVLRRFTARLTVGNTTLMGLIVATPLGWLFLTGVSGLQDPVARLAEVGLWIALPLGGLSVLQSWHQGILVHGGRTRGIPEAMTMALLGIFLVLLAGVHRGTWPGLYVGTAAMVLGSSCQVTWLWFRTRALVAMLRAD